MNRFFCITLMAIFFMSSSDWRKRASLPVPDIEKLENGLTVAWFINSNLPLIDYGLLIESGSVDDPMGKAGVAGLLDSLLTKGSAGKSAEEFSKQIEKLGASFFVNASDDTFTLGMHGLAEDSVFLMDRFAELVMQPNFNPAEFEKEKFKSVDSWKRIGDHSSTLAGLAFHRLLSSGTPYARGGILSSKELKRISLNDVVQYHRLHFVPSNAILMIVGNVDRQQISQMIRAKFGLWRGEAPQKKLMPYVHQNLKLSTSEAGLLIERKDLTQAQIRIGLQSPGVQSPDRYALAVANALIGGYFTSRLNVVLRDKMALTYGVNSSFSYSKGLALWLVSSSTRNESVGLWIETCKHILKLLQNGDISDDEVKSAKEYLIGGFPLSNNTLGAVASRWLGGYVYRLGPDFLNEFIQKVNDVSAEEVRRVVAEHLQPKKMKIVVAGNSQEIQKSLERSKLWPFKRITQRDLD